MLVKNINDHLGTNLSPGDMGLKLNVQDYAIDNFTYILFLIHTSLLKEFGKMAPNSA